VSLPRILYLDKHGALLAARGGELEVRIREEGGWKVIARYPVSKVSAIVLAVEGVSITGGALKLAALHGVDLCFMPSGRPLARLVPATYGGSVELWLKQVRQSMDKERRAELARSFVEGKLHNQKTLLRSAAKAEEAAGRSPERLREAINAIDRALAKLPSASTWKEAGLIEAEAAQAYWQAIKQLIPPSLGFQKRLKRWDLAPGQKPDPFNAALNLGYAALLREVWSAAFAVGLNPYVGFLHARRPGRMSLVLDLMEEFRPIAVDRPLLRLARSKPSSLSQLSSEQSQDAARAVWKHVYEWMRSTKPPITQLILTQARKLARSIRDNTPYTPFKAKW
jgi:CRISPR-associated protein Cas1